VNEDGREQAGMGATAADYDGDGYLDLFKTNFSSDTNTLYRNLGNGNFSDVTARAGLAVQTRYVKWGTAFVDVDNDGWKDLFVAAGHVYPFVEKSGLGEEFRQPRQLFWNRGDGQFFDMSSTAGPGISAKHSSRGIAVGDLDNDGSEEIVIVNLFEAPSLLKNFGPRGNALLVRALTESGRDAIGARITVTAGHRKQIDEVRSGGYHISQGDFRVHFGLGTVTKADVTIRWPQGATETFKDVAANQWIVAREGKGIVERHALQSSPRVSHSR
jgi:enediyne biosynthesis protein E4